jgi:hypothetical protein
VTVNAANAPAKAKAANAKMNIPRRISPLE